MSTLTLTLSGANGNPQNWTDVQTPLNEIQTWANTTKLSYVNLQDNGLRPVNLRTYDRVEAVRIKVHNSTGAGLNANDLVYFSGTYNDGTDDYPLVAKAISTATASTNYFARGVVVDAILDGADGTVAVFYEITGVDTSGGAVGDPIYLSTTAGGWTRTQPTGGQFLQTVGTITVVHASTGRVVCSLGSVPEFLTGGTSGIDASLETLTLTDALVVDGTTDTTSGTTGSIQTDGGIGVAKALFVGTTSTLTGVTTHGGNVVSDTDSTDDLGTSSVRWANLYVDSVGDTGQDLTVAATTVNLPSGHVFDYNAADVTLTHTANHLTIAGGELIATLDATAVLADGVTATTQSQSDGSTKVATTAYVDTASAGGVSLSGSTNNTIATVTGADALAGEANLTFDGTTLDVVGNAGVGIARTDGTLHVHTATAGTVAPPTTADDLIIENNNHAGLSFLMPDASQGYLNYGCPSSNSFAVLNAFYNSGSPYMNMIVNAAERMRIESSGNVGIGTSSPSSWDASADHLLVVSNSANSSGADTSNLVLDVTFATANSAIMFTNGAKAFSSAEGAIQYDHNTNSMRFRTSATERMQIDSSGNVGIGTTPSYALDVSKNNDSGYIANVDQVGTATNSHVLRLEYSGATIDNNNGVFLGCFDTTTSRMFIYSDGDLANHDGTYGTISDVKFKQDIQDARSYWDDLKSLQYRKFRHKADVEADPDAPYRLGLVAQEVEAVFPALVPESPDPLVPIVDVDGELVLDADGEPTYEEQTYHKWVKSSIIEGPIMASVVQELQQRVEALEAV